MGTAANATTLASGPIYGGSTQNLLSCTLFNASNSTLTVSSLIASRIAELTPTFNDCGTLGPGGMCTILANIVSPQYAHICKVVFKPDSSQVRGTLLIMKATSVPTYTVLQSGELR